MLNGLVGMLGGGAAAAITSFDSIATVTVGAGGAASADFSSISGTYKHLQIRYLARGSQGGVNDVALRIRFNGDTGTNYARHILQGDGATVAAFAASSGNLMTLGNIPAAAATANIFGAGICDILDYANTNKNKTLRNLEGQDRNGAGTIDLDSGLWINTAAITSISIFADAGNLVQYSSFALYGVK